MAPSDEHDQDCTTTEEHVDAENISENVDLKRQFGALGLPKLTLVLDLDETLVHTVKEAENSELYLHFVRLQECFPITVDGQPAMVRRRPFLDEFLRACARHFDIFVFTAGTSSYCQKIVMNIDPNGIYIQKCFSREHCQFGTQMSLNKDLKVVNRDLSRVILVDNNPSMFLASQLTNGIVIRTFDHRVDMKSDDQLLVLYKVLKTLQKERDVRDGIARLTREHLRKKGYSNRNG